MGSATAWQLAKRGRSVLMLEQFTRDHVSGSSHGGTRIFRLGHQQQIYTELGISALQLWRDLEAETDTTLLELTGHVEHGPQRIIDEIDHVLRGQDLATERLSPTQAHARWPGMYFDSNVLFSPDGGRVFAQRTIDALWRRIGELGGVVAANTEVLSVRVDGEAAIVETEVATFRVPSVVIAAGAWLPRLIGKEIAMRPLDPALAQPTHFTPLPEFNDMNLWPSFIHRGLSAEPDNSNMWYGLWTPGEGMKVASHNIFDELDLDHRSYAINKEQEDDIASYVSDWFPGLDSSSANSTTCIYTNEPNEHFILDRSGPVTICSPCSGQGFKYVPAIGAITAGLAMGGEQSVKEWQFLG